ncbi:hypothetical protein Esti_000344 [Eimeria stiedai]
MTCNASECAPHRGRRIRWHTIKGVRQPPNSQWHKPTPMGGGFGTNWNAQGPASRGLKRALEDMTEADTPSCSKGTHLPDRTLRPANLSCSSSQQPAAVEDAPIRLENRTRLRGRETTAQRKRGAGVPVMRPSEHVDASLLNDPEEVAEIRAEILDRARHLLQDESEIDCLVQLCVRLREKNTALLERAIHRRGVAECMMILEEALTVEANGGQLTAEGRRRTPGGVFLRLLQDRISREDKRFIWDEQNREQRMLKRRRIRNRLAGETLTNMQRGCTDDVLHTRKEAPPDIGLEEREPGELSADGGASS